MSLNTTFMKSCFNLHLNSKCFVTRHFSQAMRLFLCELGHCNSIFKTTNVTYACFIFLRKRERIEQKKYVMARVRDLNRDD